MQRARSSPSQRACRVMVPAGEFHCVRQQVQQDLPHAHGITGRLQPGGSWLSRTKRRPFCAASGPISAARSCSRPFNANDCVSSPDSIRARSSASLTRCSRCSPACRIDCVCRAAAGPVAKPAAARFIAQHAGHRRTDLMAKVGQEAGLGRRGLLGQFLLVQRQLAWRRCRRRRHNRRTSWSAATRPTPVPAGRTGCATTAAARGTPGSAPATTHGRPSVPALPAGSCPAPGARTARPPDRLQPNPGRSRPGDNGIGRRVGKDSNRATMRRSRSPSAICNGASFSPAPVRCGALPPARSPVARDVPKAVPAPGRTPPRRAAVPATRWPSAAAIRVCSRNSWLGRPSCTPQAHALPIGTDTYQAACAGRPGHALRIHHQARGGDRRIALFGTDHRLPFQPPLAPAVSRQAPVLGQPDLAVTAHMQHGWPLSAPAPAGSVRFPAATAAGHGCWPQIWSCGPHSHRG